MRKNRTIPSRGKNNNNQSNNNIGSDNLNPSINWGEVDREVFENRFRFYCNEASGSNIQSTSQQPSTVIQTTPTLSNGVNVQHNINGVLPINSTYAEDSDDEVFGIGTSTNDINGEPNFALNRALSFQKFLCSSSKKQSSSKMPNIQSTGNDFDVNQKRLEDELRSLNQKLDATQRALSMMTTFFEQQTAHGFSDNSHQQNERLSQQVNHSSFNSDQARNNEISQQLFSAIKQQHDLIQNQNNHISDQNQLILQWLHLNSSSPQRTQLDSSPSQIENRNCHHFLNQTLHSQTASQPPSTSLFDHHYPPQSSCFAFLNNNSSSNYNANPTTSSTTLNNQIRPRTRENNFVDNFRSLSHQNDIHQNSGESSLQHKNDFSSHSFSKVSNPFEFRNILKTNRKKLNNFDSLPSTSTFQRHIPSSSIPYQTSISNNTVGQGLSTLLSNLKTIRVPSRVSRTALNLNNIVQTTGEEKNLKRPKKCNLNHAVGSGLERHCSNVVSHNLSQNEHEHKTHGDGDEDDNDDNNEDDDELGDDPQNDIADDHDSVDEASQQIIKLVAATNSPNSANSSLFHHSTKHTSVRPLMPAEGQSSEPVKVTLGLSKKNSVGSHSVTSSSSINGNGWSYRPPATGSTNENNNPVSALTALPSTSVSASVSSNLSSDSHESLEDRNDSLIVQHSDSAMTNGSLGNELNDNHDLRSIINHRSHHETNNSNSSAHPELEDDDNFGLNSVDDSDVRLISLATPGTDGTPRHPSIRHSGDGEQGL